MTVNYNQNFPQSGAGCNEAWLEVTIGIQNYMFPWQLTMVYNTANHALHNLGLDDKCQ